MQQLLLLLRDGKLEAAGCHRLTTKTTCPCIRPLIISSNVERKCKCKRVLRGSGPLRRRNARVWRHRRLNAGAAATLSHRDTMTPKQLAALASLVLLQPLHQRPHMPVDKASTNQHMNLLRAGILHQKHRKIQDALIARARYTIPPASSSSSSLPHPTVPAHSSHETP